MSDRKQCIQSHLSSIPMLCAVNATGITTSQILKHWPQSSNEWDTWIDCVQLNCVETQIVAGLTRYSLTVPKTILERLEKRTDLIRAQNTQRRSQFSVLLSQLAAHSIPVIILKGNAIAQEIYLDLDYKQMNDVDLLFDKDSLDELYRVFIGYPLVTLGSLQKNIREQETYSHHWPPFFDRKMSFFVGTHWNLITPLSSISVEPKDLWQRAKPFIYDGHQALRLSNEDFIHHLCLHLSAHKVGVKELADIYNCLATWKNFDWNRFHEIVVKAKSEQRVYRALTLSQLLVFNHQVQTYLRRLEKKSHLSASHFAKLTPTTLLLSRTNYMSKVEKTYALFTLTEDPFEKTKLLTRMWKLLLLPPLQEALRLTSRTEAPNLLDRYLARVIAPWQMSKAFAQDLGWGLYIMLTLRHQWDLLKSWFAFFKKTKTRSWKDKARALGLDPLQLNSAAMLD